MLYHNLLKKEMKKKNKQIIIRHTPMNQRSSKNLWLMKIVFLIMMGIKSFVLVRKKKVNAFIVVCHARCMPALKS
jgi:hypothetical protein